MKPTSWSRCSTGALALLIAVAIVVPVTGADARASARSGVATKRSPSSALELRWRRPVGMRTELVAADDRGVVGVARRGQVVAVDPDGDVAWSTKIPLGEGQGPGSAAIDGDLVVVSIFPSRVVAMSRASGAPRWEVELPAVRAIALGRGADGSALVATVGRRGALRVLDGADGTVRWEAALYDSDDEPPVTGVWLRRGRLVASWFDPRGSHLVAFDAASGAPAWSHDAAEYASAPAVTDTGVSFGENVAVDDHGVVSAAVRSLDVLTGAARWSRAVRSRGAFLPEIDAAAGLGRVVVVDHRGTVRAYSEDSGALQWHQATRREQFGADVRVAGGVVTIPVLGSSLLGLDVTTGRDAHVDGLGRVQLAATIEATAPAGGRLYVLVQLGDGSGEVWAYDAASGPG